MKNPRLLSSLRTIFPLALALTQTLTLFSQGHKYIPFPDSAFIWRVWSYDSFNNKESNYQYFTNGEDTMINGQEYIIVHYSKNVKLNPWPMFYVRNDTLNKKVYVFPSNFNPKVEGLLYDYSLKVGDTTESNLNGGGGMANYPEGLVVTKIDSIWLDDGWHHRWHFFENGTFDTVFPMIEGIGGRCGPFEGAGHWEYGAWLDCAMKNGKAFFPYGIDTCQLATSIKKSVAPITSYSLFPNPVLDELHISSDRAFIKGIALHIYEITGKEVFCPVVVKGENEIIMDVSGLPNGLYFLLLGSDSEHMYKGRFIKSEIR